VTIVRSAGKRYINTLHENLRSQKEKCKGTSEELNGFNEDFKTLLLREY